MKNMFSYILIVVLVFGLVSCSGMTNADMSEANLERMQAQDAKALAEATSVAADLKLGVKKEEL